jgi:hypothetical protein
VRSSFAVLPLNSLSEPAGVGGVEAEAPNGAGAPKGLAIARVPACESNGVLELVVDPNGDGMEARVPASEPNGELAVVVDPNGVGAGAGTPSELDVLVVCDVPNRDVD